MYVENRHLWRGASAREVLELHHLSPTVPIVFLELKVSIHKIPTFERTIESQRLFEDEFFRKAQIQIFTAFEHS